MLCDYEIHFKKFANMQSYWLLNITANHHYWDSKRPHLSFCAVNKIPSAYYLALVFAMSCKSRRKSSLKSMNVAWNFQKLSSFLKLESFFITVLSLCRLGYPICLLTSFMEKYKNLNNSAEVNYGVLYDISCMLYKHIKVCV